LRLRLLALFLALGGLAACQQESAPVAAENSASAVGAAAETPEQRAARLQATFPAQQRPPADPAQVAQGNGIYDVNCRGCHGQDLRGGDLGGPNLLRSNLVLADQSGELIGPIVRAGSTPAEGTPMPPLPLDDNEVRAVAAYIHSVAATAQGQGAPPPGAPVALNIVVGNADAGREFFEARCTACHSLTGDLRNIATRIGSPENVQNSWVAGRRFGTPDPTADPTRRLVRVTVTLDNGEAVSGVLGRRDDFVISLTDELGQYRSFSLHGSSSPAVSAIDMQDPLRAHRDLLGELSDELMHDVTAFLVTLQ
jgi:cytochrome c oxidase cbb3-type subunit 3